MRGIAPSGPVRRGRRQALLDKVDRVPVPIPPIDPADAVKVSLVHPEGDRNVLWLLLLFVGILVAHTQPPHDLAASRIVDIVGGCDVWDAVPLQPVNDGPAGLRDKSPAPEFPSETIAEFMAVIRALIDISAGGRVLL